MAPSETFLRLHELSRKSRGAEYMDAAALPSASHLEREFGLFNPEGSGCCPTVDATGAVTCTCSGCERWSKYVAGTLGERWPTYKQYEVLTAEYVAKLARYLRSRRSEIIGADDVGEPLRSLRVLELGAGDGRLTRHLREELDGHSVEVYATDDHSLGLARGSAHGVVAERPGGVRPRRGEAQPDPDGGDAQLPVRHRPLPGRRSGSRIRRRRASMGPHTPILAPGRQDPHHGSRRNSKRRGCLHGHEDSSGPAPGVADRSPR